MGLLHYRDPATGNWVPLSTQGPAGPQGPVGPEGPPGDAEEVWVGPNAPVGNNFELWLDTDDTGAAPVDPATVFLSKSGGAMSGPLLLAADPQAAKEAATRDYVDRHRGGRNRIINGAFQVNQREWTGHPGPAVSGFYGFDRWKVWTANGACSYTPVAVVPGDGLPGFARNYARLTVTGQVDEPATPYSCLLRQSIEDVRTLAGKDVTISFWARAASGTPKVGVAWTQVPVADADPSTVLGPNNLSVTIATGAFKRYSVTTRLPLVTAAGIGHWDLDLWTSAGSFYTANSTIGIQNGTIDIWGVQVEEGTVATPFEERSYADELRDCQRYYERYTHDNTNGGSFIPSSPTRLDTANRPVTLLLYSEKRAKPAINVSDPTHFTAIPLLTADPPAVCTQFGGTLIGTGLKAANVYWYCAAWTAYQPSFMVMNNPAGYIEISAEL